MPETGETTVLQCMRSQKDGSLRLCSIEKTGGRTPRDFQIFSDFLVVANQDSDSLTVLPYRPGEKETRKDGDPGGCGSSDLYLQAVGEYVAGNSMSTERAISQ